MGIGKVKMMGFEPWVREVKGTDMEGQEYSLLTIGRRSYITEAHISVVQQPMNHVLIGSYTAIAHDVSFDILTQHDYTRPSIFPWSNPYSKIFDCDPGSYERRQIIIGHDVWIGRGAVLMGGVRIGNGAVIAADSVVTKDVEPYSIVGGNPARHIKYRFDPQTVAAMQRIRWWDWPEERIVAAKEWMLADAKTFADHFSAEVRTMPPIRPRNQLAFLRPENRVFLYCMDPEALVPLWTKILLEFLQVYAGEEQVSLVLLGKFREKPEFLQQVKKIIHQNRPENPPHIVLIEKPEGIALDLLAAADVFITNRQYSSLLYLDFADRLGVPFVSGTDTHVFGRKGHLHQPMVCMDNK